MTDCLNEFAIIRDSGLLEAVFCGLSVKVWLALAALCWVAWDVLHKGGKVVRWGYGKCRRRDDSLDEIAVRFKEEIGTGEMGEPGEAKAPWTHAMQVAYQCLVRGRRAATYNPVNHELTVPGLSVRFHAETDDPSVIGVTGAPDGKDEHGNAVSYDLAVMLDNEEYRALCQKASALRAVVIRRDRAEANMKAAAAMAQAPYAERPLRIYPPGECALDPVLDEDEAGGIGWLNVPVDAAPAMPPQQQQRRRDGRPLRVPGVNQLRGGTNPPKGA